MIQAKEWDVGTVPSLFSRVSTPIVNKWATLTKRPSKPARPPPSKKVSK